MQRSPRFKVLWTIGMTVGGLVAAAVAYGVTSSWWWGVAALFGSGVVLNAIGQAVTQPARAGSAGRRRSTSPPASLRGSGESSE